MDGSRWKRVSWRCADSRGDRGSVSTNSNNDGTAASLKPRTYLAGEVSERVGRRPPHVVFSFITYANYIFKFGRENSRLFMA